MVSIHIYFRTSRIRWHCLFRKPLLSRTPQISVTSWLIMSILIFSIIHNFFLWVCTSLPLYAVRYFLKLLCFVKVCTVFHELACCITPNVMTKKASVGVTISLYAIATSSSLAFRGSLPPQVQEGALKRHPALRGSCWQNRGGQLILDVNRSQVPC